MEVHRGSIAAGEFNVVSACSLPVVCISKGEFAAVAVIEPRWATSRCTASSRHSPLTSTKARRAAL